MSDRDIRKIMNSTAPSLNTDGSVSRSIPEGSTNFVLSSNRQLAMFKKHKGRLWKTYLSKDGNQYVDKTLRTNTLEYTHKFIDYRTFAHNFEGATTTIKRYAPWWGTAEATSMDDHRSGYVVPFDMTCYRVILQCSSIANANSDLTIRVEKIDSGDADEETIATAVYSTDGIANYTNFQVNQSDFDNTPKLITGVTAGLSIQSSSPNLANTADWKITSVWRVEVVI